MPLYPPIEPFKTGMMQVSALHSVYFEVCGNPNGHPALFIHGGPGGGCRVQDRCFFDPAFYKIVLMDQRGAGRSKPHAELEENTTWELIKDIEKLREMLHVEAWVVFGGSWGSCLSLIYAECHPSRVLALVLRGIFTLRRKELTWFYQEGASMLFPDVWESFVAPIPEAERCDLISAYHRRLTGKDRAAQLACAKAWSTWECATSKLFVDPEYLKKGSDPEWALAFARIECHYFVNAGFFKYDGQILAEVDKIRHIPTTIVQGRYDVVCPARTAWDLHRNFPEADLQIIDDAGHSSGETGITNGLVAACDKLRDHMTGGHGKAPASGSSSSATGSAAAVAHTTLKAAKNTHPEQLPAAGVSSQANHNSPHNRIFFG